jgi:hypothetical protein
MTNVSATTVDQLPEKIGHFSTDDMAISIMITCSRNTS